MSRICLLLLLLPLFQGSCRDSDQPEAAAATVMLPPPAPTEPVNLQTPEEEVTDMVPLTGSRPTPTNVAASPTASTRANADVTFVRAHDLVAGFGGKMVTVGLPDSSGPTFKVEWRQE